jgi:hypothetical protein
MEDFHATLVTRRSSTSGLFPLLMNFRSQMRCSIFAKRVGTKHDTTLVPKGTQNQIITIRKSLQVTPFHIRMRDIKVLSDSGFVQYVQTLFALV